MTSGSRSTIRFARHSRRRRAAVLIVIVIAMIIGVIVGAYPRTKIKYFIAMIYNYLLVYLSINPRLFHNRTRFELMVESNLYVAGLISFI